MTPRGALVIFTLAAIGWLAVPAIKESGTVRYDLMGLLPADDSGPMKAAAVASLAQASGSQAYFLVEATDRASAGEAADTLAMALAGTRVFTGALSRFPEPDLGPLREFYSGQGPRLPGDNSNLAGNLLRRLHSAFPHPLAPDIRADPFGNVLEWVGQIPWPASQLSWENGRISGETSAGGCALVVATLGGDALSMEFPALAASAANAAIEQARSLHPGATVRKAGAIFHAAHAQETARGDMELISLGSILGIAAVMLVLFRSPVMLTLCLSSIAVGLFIGTATTLAFFGEIHLMVLVFGASLMGEAADYSIQLTVARIGAGADRDWLSRIMPGLRLALLTSLAGYAAMCMAPLPFLGQMGLFALSGLAGSFIFVRYAGPAMLGKGRPGILPAATADWSRQMKRVAARLGRPAVPAGYALAILGVACSSLVGTSDDATSLIPRPPGLKDDEDRLRLLTGTGYSQRFLLINPEEGTDEACLRSTEAILPRLHQLRNTGEIGDFACLARIVPSQQRQQQLAATHAAAKQAQAAQISRVLGETGLMASLATQELPAQGLRLEQFLEMQASMPFRHLRVTHDGKVAHLIVIYPPTDSAALTGLAAGSTSVSVVDKLGDANRALASLRTYGYWGIPLLLALCAVVISTRFGPQGALSVALPTVLGVTWAIPLAHFAGSPVSGLSFMALLLVVGVGINYGIFIKEGGLDNRGSLTGIAACAFTTLLAFGLLAFSGMPALSWIGATLGSGILVTLACLPLALAPRGSLSEPRDDQTAPLSQ